MDARVRCRVRAGARRRRVRWRRRGRRRLRLQRGGPERHDRHRRLVDGLPVGRGGCGAVQRGEPGRADHGRPVRHRRRLREVLRRRDRHLHRLAPDRRGGGSAGLREGRRQLRRGPDRERRDRGVDQQEPRGRLPHDGAAQGDLEQGLHGRVARRPRPVAAGHRAVALRPGHGLRHVRLLHRRDQRRGRRDPRGLRGVRGRQPARHRRRRGRGRARLLRLLLLRGRGRPAEPGRASTAATAASSLRRRPSRTTRTRRSRARCSCIRPRSRSTSRT